MTRPHKPGDGELLAVDASCKRKLYLSELTKCQLAGSQALVPTQGHLPICVAFVTTDPQLGAELSKA